MQGGFRDWGAPQILHPKPFLLVPGRLSDRLRFKQSPVQLQSLILWMPLGRWFRASGLGFRAELHLLHPHHRSFLDPVRAVAGTHLWARSPDPGRDFRGLQWSKEKCESRVLGSCGKDGKNAYVIPRFPSYTCSILYPKPYPNY